MADRPNVLFFHVDNLGFGLAQLLQRGPVPRRVDQTYRPVRRGRIPAHELRSRSAVHPVSFGAPDRPSCCAIRQI